MYDISRHKVLSDGIRSVVNADVLGMGGGGEVGESTLIFSKDTSSL